jgi:putative acetyltransferase
MTVQIQPIEPQQIIEAKRVILSVARNIFQWPASLDDLVKQFDEQGDFLDVDNPQMYYFDRQGLFLVAIDQGRVIGTGAIRRLEGDAAELKRLWLLEAYQGRGIGYQLMQTLLRFAQTTGYRHIRLLTDRRQDRAIRFYQRIGFQPIECDSEDPNDICMEMVI